MEQILPANKPKISTMKITESTKSRIENLKVYPRETYEEILIRVLEILNIARQSPEKARTKLMVLEKQRRMNFK